MRGSPKKSIGERQKYYVAAIQRRYLPARRADRSRALDAIIVLPGTHSKPRVRFLTSPTPLAQRRPTTVDDP